MKSSSALWDLTAFPAVLGLEFKGLGFRDFKGAEEAAAGEVVHSGVESRDNFGCKWFRVWGAMGFRG